MRVGAAHETLQVSDDGLFFKARIRNLRRPLAVARLLTGDTDGAAAWFDEGDDQSTHFLTVARDRVVQEALGRSRTGAFDLTLGLCREGGGWLSVLDKAVWTRLACRLARRDGLTEIARMYSRRSRQLLDWRDGLESLDTSVSSREIDHIVSRTRAFAQILGRAQDGLESDCGLHPDRPPPTRDDARRLIRAYLDRPPEPFAVWGWRDAESFRGDSHQWPEDPLAFRLLRSGEQAVAIGGTRLLPGAPRAGRWLLRPDDGSGAPPPLYTGLPSSMLGPHCPPPELSGDRLSVSVVELADELSLLNPLEQPPGLTCGSRELLLEDLERDRDGDGLTDVEERTLFFTDPARADTDGDGEPDGTDSLPQVAYQAREADRRSAAIATFFDCLLGSPDPSEADSEPPLAPVCRVARRVPRSGVEPVYFVGRRSEVGFLKTRIPVVVLEPDEYGELRRRRPERGQPPLRIEVLELDEDASRAFLKWSGGSHSGELELTWDGPGWRVREISSSVS
jgi:hypothetical protein